MIPSPSVSVVVMQSVFILFAMAQPLVIYMISRVLKRLDDLNNKVNVQNGRILKLETRQEAIIKDLEIVDRIARPVPPVLPSFLERG
jgi:hypothetical protein